MTKIEVAKRMTPKFAIALGALALALTAPFALNAKPAAKVKAAARAPWTAITATTVQGGVRMGNPAAKVKLVEYASYTCPHCAHFQEEGVPVIEQAHILPGKVSLEVRPLLRDPLDVTAYLLARCGGLSKFFGNHKLLFATQKDWMGRAQDLSPISRRAWTTGPIAERPARIAADLGMDTMMIQQRGLTALQVKMCLSSTAMQEGGARSTKLAQTLGITGTPGFLMNGKLVPETYSWERLEPQLTAATR